MRTSNRVVQVDGSLVRRRMSDVGVGERALARRTGLGDATLRAILYRSELQTSVTLADIMNLGEYLGLSLAQMVVSDPRTLPQPSGDPHGDGLGDGRSDGRGDTHGDDLESVASDAGRLAAVLLGGKQLLLFPDTNLAIALGWTTERLRTAMSALDDALRPVGLFVHANKMGVTIRAASDESDASAKLLHLRDHREGLQPASARLLLKVLRGKVSATATKVEQELHLNELRNRRAIVTEAGSKSTSGHRLTAEVEFSLMLADTYPE